MNGEKENILVSACLAGRPCRYDERDKKNESVLALKKNYNLIPVCPEVLGGLNIPRPPSEIVGGTGCDVLYLKAKVIAKGGDDKTSYFIKGANETLALAKNAGIKKAVMKKKSPSCGSGEIPDGSFSGKLRDGDGVTAALLKENGIEVYTEDNINELM